MPNWPRNSCRAKPSSSRFDERPIVASSSCTWSSVRPIPVSCTRSVPSPVTSGGSMRTRRALPLPSIRRPASTRRTRPSRRDGVDGVLQQLADVDARAAVEVMAQQVDDPAEVDLEGVAHVCSCLPCDRWCSVPMVQRRVWSAGHGTGERPTGAAQNHAVPGGLGSRPPRVRREPEPRLRGSSW